MRYYLMMGSILVFGTIAYYARSESQCRGYTPGPMIADAILISDCDRHSIGAQPVKGFLGNNLDTSTSGPCSELWAGTNRCAKASAH